MRGRPLRPMVLALGVSGRRSLAVACDAALRLGLPRGVSGWRTGGGLAGGEGVESAETGVEFGGGDAALAVEPAEEMGGGTLAFEGIAFEAGRDQVAIGVSAGADAGHEVVETLDAGVGAAQTIKTMAAFAGGGGVAEGAGLSF